MGLISSQNSCDQEGWGRKIQGGGLDPLTLHPFLRTALSPDPLLIAQLLVDPLSKV